ncbi:MAG: patatin-like phospholipase family protein [Desulfitobacteriaceae bacterium]
MSKYRIMTFDGGGIRGAFTAILVKRLRDRFPDLLQATDLFAGTSTGSFIALGLAYGLEPENLVELYSEENSKFIFSSEHWELFRPKYDNKQLQETLARVFPASLRLRDLARHKVLVPSFAVIGPHGGSWQPFFYHNYPGSETEDIRVIDVALASSAAPVYFPSHNEQIDGGVFANNPGTAAIAIARDQHGGDQELDDVFLLSLGTGFSPHRIKADTSHWGAFKWVLYPHPSFPILSILFDGVVEADAYYGAQLLREQYFRLNPLLPQPMALDDYRKIPELINIAEKVDLTAVFTWIEQNWL